MRIVSWNMGYSPFSSYKDTHDQAWHFLLGLGPDLALVQEARPPAWVRGECNLIQGPIEQWGSAIVSTRLPLSRAAIPRDNVLRRFGTYLAFATASLPDGNDTLVVSVHSPAEPATRQQLEGIAPKPIRRPGTKTVMMNDLVFHGLQPQLVGDRFVIGGDWNTGLTQGSNEGRTAGADFFSRAKKRGWFDCVHRAFGDEELHTTFIPKSKVIQDDHIFCDKDLGAALTGKPWVAGDARTVKLSDHAPLVIDFDVPPIGMANRDLARSKSPS
jgi:hypothetical protein